MYVYHTVPKGRKNEEYVSEDVYDVFIATN
jgi:hypothetical protein